MKIELNAKERAVFIDMAVLNLDYWMYEADHREYYKEIIGTLPILKKLDIGSTADRYINDYYALLKRHDYRKGLQLFLDIFPEYMARVEVD